MDVFYIHRQVHMYRIKNSIRTKISIRKIQIFKSFHDLLGIHILLHFLETGAGTGRSTRPVLSLQINFYKN